MPLLVVQAFVNTFEADTDTDLLSDPEPARRWFVEAGLIAHADALLPGDLQVARQVRENIRDLLALNAGSPPDGSDREPLATLAERARPQMHIDANGAVHIEAEPARGLDGAWLRLLLVIRDAQIDQTWQRLKACANHECGWAFYDRSHSSRGRWCDMAICGNRMKNRSLRNRRRGSRA